MGVGIIVNLITLILIILNVIYFKNKKYLYLFVPCMLFLPKYYGVELSYNSPIIEIRRIMFLVFFAYTFFNKRKELKISKASLKEVSKEYYFLFGYFILRIVSNMYYVFAHSMAIKTILGIVFEQVLFLICIYLLSPNEDELLHLLKSIVWCANVLFIVGIFESFTFIRPFDILYTVSRGILNEHYVRLGLLRATTTLGMPIAFGNMCIIVLPIIIYLAMRTEQKRYYFVAILNLMAVIHSGARSALLFYFFLIVFFGAFIRTRKELVSYLKFVSITVLSVVAIALILSGVNPKYEYYYSGTAKAALNEVGFDFELDEDAPDGVSGYGGNEDTGSYSRVAEFSGIKYALEQNVLFGLGSGCVDRGEIRYYWFGHWKPHKAIDVGIVEIFMCEGVVGFLAHLSLFIYIAFAVWKNKKGIEKRLLYFAVICYLISTLGTANMYAFLFVIMAVLAAYRNAHEQ